MKNPSKSQVGLKKLPKDVRNKMGYFANGGNVHKMLSARRESRQHLILVQSPF